MQSYLHDYNSGTYIEIEGEAPYDTNAQIMWDKEAEIKAGIEAEDRTTMENDTVSIRVILHMESISCI